MNIEEYADKLFNEALEECLLIRMERKSIYGNSWFQQDAVDANFWGGIINKVNRLRILHNKRFEKNNIERYEDCLRDLIILALFTLASRKDELKKLKLR